MAAVFLICACVVFTLKYVISGANLPLVFDYMESVNQISFYLNFYLPFCISAVCLFGLLFSKDNITQGFCLIVGLITVVVAGYVINDLFTIKLCMYSAWVLITIAAFKPPWNYGITAIVVLFITFFLVFPGFWGNVREDWNFFTPGIGELIVLLLYLAAPAAAFSSIRYLSEKYINSEATVVHLNTVGTKLLLFNHRLQEYARIFGNEAVKKDRLRFTSDLHDSCGYVFTNIIAVSNAAMSFSHMEPEKAHDTFLLIRDQAQQGLHRTREILHTIRELENPVKQSIETIFEMKAIFEEVTGIRVDIESGNMKHNYDPVVNMVLTRIVQEAFTNSIRHGQASRILIHFWELGESLCMVVTDNGIGATQISKGIGLAGMEERLAALGGTLEAYSPEDGGFCLKVIIPLMNTIQPAPDTEKQEIKFKSEDY